MTFWNNMIYKIDRIVSIQNIRKIQPEIQLQIQFETIEIEILLKQNINSMNII